MKLFAFETIEHNFPTEAKVFITSISSSCIHWHYDYEVMMVLDGSIDLLLGSDVIRYREGDLVLLNSQVLHGFLSNQDANLVLLVQLPKAMVNRGLMKEQNYCFHFNSRGETPLPEKTCEAFRASIARLGLCSLETGIIHELKTQSLVYELLAQLFEHAVYDIRLYPGIGNMEEKNELVIKIGALIEDRMNNPDLVEEILKEFSISEKSLYRYLKSSIGMTLKDMIDIVRVERVKHLLKCSNKSLGYIADECGFSNEMTFYRMFKKKTGLTPKEYRENGPGSVKYDGIQNYLQCDLQVARKKLRIMLDRI